MSGAWHVLQVVIVPILKKNTDAEAVLAAADALAAAAKAAGIRAKVDAGTEKTPGFKFSFWEMKVPCLATPQVLILLGHNEDPPTLHSVLGIPNKAGTRFGASCRCQ